MNKYIAILIAFLLVGTVLAAAQTNETSTATLTTDANVTTTFTAAPTDANVTTTFTAAPTDANVTTVTETNATTTEVPTTTEATTTIPTTTEAPKFDTKITSAPNTTKEELTAAIEGYNGVVTSIDVDGVPVLKASVVAAGEVLTAHAYFLTNDARTVFVDAANNHTIPGVSSAEVVAPTTTPAATKAEEKKNHAGVIAGVVIGVVALVAIIVGVVIYRRRSTGRNGEYVSIDRKGTGAYATNN